MLGYIKINKPEMKVKEYEVYRGVYCSLCKALGKYFGQLSRMILSYDLTFLAILRIASAGKLLNFKNSHCPFNPSKKCNFCTNADEEMKFAASMTIIMFYHKVKDNIADNSFFKRILFYLILPFASLKYKKAKKFYPDLALEIAQCMVEQEKVEREKTQHIDKAAHSSADALGKILSFGESERKHELYHFGYMVGKWVYLVDAADDVADDIKSGGFNVFVNKYEIKNIEQFEDNGIKKEVEEQLNLSLAMAIEAFGTLGETPFEPIINNILIDGMYYSMRKILTKTAERKHK